MHRFFIAADNIKGRQAYLDENESKHALQVLRLKPGDEIVLFDGGGTSYRAFISGTQGKQLSTVLEETLEKEPDPRVRIHLVQGLPKGDKMEMIIQKAVEIGVHAVYPLQCQRSVARLKDGSAVRKLKRWELIALEACKQSGRNRLLRIHPLQSVFQLLDVMNGRLGIVLYEHENKIGLKGILRSLMPRCINADLFLMVGPEGGWEPDEIAQLTHQGIHIASLGARILRTETAGLVAGALALYEADELG